VGSSGNPRKIIRKDSKIPYDDRWFSDDKVTKNTPKQENQLYEAWVHTFIASHCVCLRENFAEKKNQV
jgi:hypothetical protein